MISNMLSVIGYCPMCSGETLGLDGLGEIICTNADCPDRLAVTKLLRNRQSEHIVVFHSDDTFSVQHPMKERIDGKLHLCRLRQELSASGTPPMPPGRYIAHQAHHRWTFERIGD